MYRLTDDVARRRQLYLSPIIGAPHVILIDLPSAARGPGLALGRYYAALPETEFEIAEFEEFLAAPRPGPVPPDLLDNRPTAICSSELLVIRYDPPTDGWPWVSVCRWPMDLRAADDSRRDMARDCYTFEAFESDAALERHSVALLDALARHRELSVRTLSADLLGTSGSA